MFIGGGSIKEKTTTKTLVLSSKVKKGLKEKEGKEFYTRKVKMYSLILLFFIIVVQIYDSWSVYVQLT